MFRRSSNCDDYLLTPTRFDRRYTFFEFYDELDYERKCDIWPNYSQAF